MIMSNLREVGAEREHGVAQVGAVGGEQAGLAQGEGGHARKSGFCRATWASEPGTETTSGMPRRRVTTAAMKPLGRIQWACSTSGAAWRASRSTVAMPAAKSAGLSRYASRRRARSDCIVRM